MHEMCLQDDLQGKVMWRKKFSIVRFSRKIFTKSFQIFERDATQTDALSAYQS